MSQTTLRNPVSAQSRGLLRQFKAALEAQIQTAVRLAPQIHKLAEELAGRRNEKGRARVWPRLAKLMEGHSRLHAVTYTAKGFTATWAYLVPCGPQLRQADIDTPGQGQDCIAVGYTLIRGDARGGGVEQGRWTLEVSDHALHRLIDRNPGVDLGRVLFDAHDAALKMSTLATVELDPESNLATFSLAAGAGVFVCEMQYGRLENGQATAGIRARTWMDNDDRPDRLQPAPAGKPGERLMDDHLLPAPLRGDAPAVCRQTAGFAA